ncbi:MAG TPA: hypothetical protein VGQ83_33480 [Polyangia bacterium]|jgi:hypothetical protein
MSDLGVFSSDPWRQPRLNDPSLTAPGALPSATATQSRGRPRPALVGDSVVHGPCPRCAVAPDRPARSADVLLAAMKRSARSVMPPAPPPKSSVWQGLETVGAHGLLFAAEHVAEAVAPLSPLVTFLEAGAEVIDQNVRGDTKGQRKSAAAGFAHALAVALKRGTSCADDVRVDRLVTNGRAAVPNDHHQREFYDWGATNALRFASTLSKTERMTLMRTLGQMPRDPAEGRGQEVASALANPLQRAILGAEYHR